MKRSTWLLVTLRVNDAKRILDEDLRAHISSRPGQELDEEESCMMDLLEHLEVLTVTLEAVEPQSDGDPP